MKNDFYGGRMEGGGGKEQLVLCEFIVRSQRMVMKEECDLKNSLDGRLILGVSGGGSSISFVSVVYENMVM